MFDVIIVGWGPTGMVAACLLGLAGYRVGVFERYPATFKLPRVGAVHDDVFRVFQEIGIAETILPATAAGTSVSASWRWRTRRLLFGLPRTRFHVAGAAEYLSSRKHPAPPNP